MPFWSRRSDEERLFWTRDDRFARHVYDLAPQARILDLDAGWCVIGPAQAMDDGVVAGLADGRPYGLVPVDPAAAIPDRYLQALAAAVQASGIADRIGMDQSPVVAAGEAARLLLHAAQPAPRRVPAHRRPAHAPDRRMGVPLPARDADAAPVDLRDRRRGDRRRAAPSTSTCSSWSGSSPASPSSSPPNPSRPIRLAINLTPASLLDPRFEPRALAARVRRAGLAPRQVTLECTEQQAIADVVRLKRAVRCAAAARLRRRRRRRGGRLRLLHAHRRAPAERDQDRPRDRPGQRPRRREAGAHRGLRGLRPPDRCPAGRRGDREARGPRGARRRRRRHGPGLPARARRRRSRWSPRGGAPRPPWRRSRSSARADRRDGPRLPGPPTEAAPGRRGGRPPRPGHRPGRPQRRAWRCPYFGARYSARAATSSRQKAGMSSTTRPQTRLPSRKAGSSTQVAPALTRSSRMPERPRRPAARRRCAPRSR